MKSDSTCNLSSVSEDKAIFVDLHCILYSNNSEYLCWPFSDNKKGIGHMVSLKLWGAKHIPIMVELSHRASDPWGERTATYVLFWYVPL